MKIKLGAYLLASMAIASAANADELKVSTKGGLKVSSGDYSFQVGGRLMYDYDKTEKNDVTITDRIDLRRGRTYLKGDIGDNWAFKTQFNVNGDGAEDLYLAYKGWGKGAVLKIGKQKMPFMLEELTSSKDISALERSALTERFALGRQEGVTLAGALAGNSTYAVGLFSAEADNVDDNEFGLAARYTIAPIKTDTSVLHFGVAYKDVFEDSAFGLEAAVTAGPFHVQAEYIDGEISNVDVDGFYVQAGWVLTGESRPYKSGIFKRIAPAGNGGAWELVARFSDGEGKYKDIGLSSSEGESTTIGVNWYPHKNVKFGINYMDGKTNNGDEGNELRVRAQLTF